MLTAAAARDTSMRLPTVLSRSELHTFGIDDHRVGAQLAAHRWTRHGIAIVTHNAPPTAQEGWLIALINCRPRAVLTSFTAAQAWGLRGWERPVVHVLAPRGTARPPALGMAVKVHRAFDWDTVERAPGNRSQRLAPALVVAARSFTSARPACGLLAAAVQQRLLRPDQLRSALRTATRSRHRGALLLAVDDIAQGAQALSEIDFVSLCRRHRLPLPEQQTVRRGAGGRRRYLDATWRLPDGRLLVVEVDGALHLAATTWWDDQLRQNGLTLQGVVVLRFPSAVVRHEPELVVAQLRQALGLPTNNHVEVWS